MSRYVWALWGFFGAAACTAQPAPEAPRVVAVYPSAHELPENILRFYVAFSEPMREGEFLEYIRLERVDTGEDLSGVFFDNIHELWSRDRMRITLLVDPGRVKRGLQANLERGRAFERGGQYRLTVLGDWRSATGAPLERPFEHAFRAVSQDTRAVDVAAWCLQVPRVGSSDPLRVDFTEPVDHVSVHQLTRVLDPSGTTKPGRWDLAPGEREAAWTPAEPWAEPVLEHALLVSGRFEDIAGNNLNASFEHPEGAVADGAETVAVRRPFSEGCRAHPTGSGRFVDR